MGGYLHEQYHGVSGHGGYDVNNHSYGYEQAYYTHSQWQQSQPQIQQHPHQSAYGVQYDPSQFGYTIPTSPIQPQAIKGVTVVVDTNVLLDYLMVIQKFVADIERTKWPSVVVIPSVVISELDWCVGPARARSFFNCKWTEQRFPWLFVGKRIRGRISHGPLAPHLGGSWTS